MTRRRMVVAAVPFNCWCATEWTSASKGLRRFLGVNVHGPTFLMMRARVLSERMRCWTASGVMGTGCNLSCGGRGLNRNLNLTLDLFVELKWEIKRKIKITIKSGE